MYMYDGNMVNVKESFTIMDFYDLQDILSFTRSLCSQIYYCVLWSVDLIKFCTSNKYTGVNVIQVQPDIFKDLTFFEFK